MTHFELVAVVISIVMWFTLLRLLDAVPGALGSVLQFRFE